MHFGRFVRPFIKSTKFEDQTPLTTAVSFVFPLSNTRDLIKSKFSLQTVKQLGTSTTDELKLIRSSNLIHRKSEQNMLAHLFTFDPLT